MNLQTSLEGMSGRLCARTEEERHRDVADCVFRDRRRRAVDRHAGDHSGGDPVGQWRGRGGRFRTGLHQVRRSRRPVISFFATVGNYDYGFYWYLYHDGTIQLEVKLTGIIQTAAIAPGADYPYGGMVAEGLGGPNHQHFFCARLHMMVDGEHNSVTEHEYHPRPWGKENPYGNVFDVTARTLSRELDACREADGRTGRFWKIINPNRRNAVGKHPGYKLVAQPSPVLLAQEGSSIDRRGGFASKHL
jgi:primary-amine oxidase